MVDATTQHQDQQATAEQAKAKEQHAREQQKKGAEAKQRSVEETQAVQVKPTPTQEENDLAALGVPLETHEPDGSGPEPELRMVRNKQSEAGKPSGGTYATRSATASQPAATHAAERKPT
jgi:hypothetical protein